MSAIAMPSPKEFIAMLASASPEERAEIGALFYPVPCDKVTGAPTKKTTTKVAVERPPVCLLYTSPSPPD